MISTDQAAYNRMRMSLQDPSLRTSSSEKVPSGKIIEGLHDMGGLVFLMNRQDRAAGNGTVAW